MLAQAAFVLLVGEMPALQQVAIYIPKAAAELWSVAQPPIFGDQAQLYSAALLNKNASSVHGKARLTVILPLASREWRNGVQL